MSVQFVLLVVTVLPIRTSPRLPSDSNRDARHVWRANFGRARDAFSPAGKLVFHVFDSMLRMTASFGSPLESLLELYPFRNAGPRKTTPDGPLHFFESDSSID